MSILHSSDYRGNLKNPPKKLVHIFDHQMDVFDTFLATKLIVRYYNCQLFFDQKLLLCDLASAYFDIIILQVCTFPYIIYSHLLFSLFKVDIVLLEYYISNTCPPSVVGLVLLFSASTQLFLLLNFQSCQEEPAWVVVVTILFLRKMTRVICAV